MIMMIARWSIEARFGHKQDVIDLLRKWVREIGSQIGFSDDRTKLLTGSIGVSEATVQSETVIRDLSELDTAWAKLATIEAHQRWGKELEPYVVSGSSRWEIFRVL
jgi:hypothetical protein